LSIKITSRPSVSDTSASGSAQKQPSGQADQPLSEHVESISYGPGGIRVSGQPRGPVDPLHACSTSSNRTWTKPPVRRTLRVRRREQFMANGWS